MQYAIAHAVVSIDRENYYAANERPDVGWWFDRRKCTPPIRAYFRQFRCRDHVDEIMSKILPVTGILMESVTLNEWTAFNNVIKENNKIFHPSTLALINVKRI